MLTSKLLQPRKSIPALKRLNNFVPCAEEWKKKDLVPTPDASKIQMFINSTKISVPAYYTVLQAVKEAGIALPTFCYHEKLAIAGNCRMCLVHIVGNIKPMPACAINVTKNMKVYTNSDMTRRAQEGVLEFILANHPLDCPICDQGGECDLQDLSMYFGSDRSRFTEIHFGGKHASESGNWGPLIHTTMTRCIHCTRCIRFASQICGTDVLGTTGRSSNMLIGTYVNKMFLSELSGNVVDLCPVGALTSAPYMYKARAWELSATNSIDITDATGTNIVLNHRFDRVLRVLPRENPDINQEWVSDKGRFSIDSLEIQRIVSPMQRTCDCLQAVEWEYALTCVSNWIRACYPETIVAVAGPQTNVEALVAAKDLLNTLGSEHTYVLQGQGYSYTSTDFRDAYCVNMPMKDIVRADKILLVGTNPRFEAPILNVWIREAWQAYECEIYYIGPPTDFNYPVTYLGTNINRLECENPLSDAKRPLAFVGAIQIDSATSHSAMNVLQEALSVVDCEEGWNKIHIVPRDASVVGAFEVGWKPAACYRLHQLCPRLMICLGADEIFNTWTPPSGCYVVYIGFQGDRGAQNANVILPGAAFSESGGTYVNMECRSQCALPAVTPPGKARVDWKIIRALAEYLHIPFYYKDNDTICQRLWQISPLLCDNNKYQPRLWGNLVEEMTPDFGQCDGMISNIPIKDLTEYYCSDIFTNNSPTLARATKAAKEARKSIYDE